MVACAYKSQEAEARGLWFKARQRQSDPSIQNERANGMAQVRALEQNALDSEKKKNRKLTSFSHFLSLS
jgi:hypothetical protein